MLKFMIQKHVMKEMMSGMVDHAVKTAMKGFPASNTRPATSSFNFQSLTRPFPSTGKKSDSGSSKSFQLGQTSDNVLPSLVSSILQIKLSYPLL